MSVGNVLTTSTGASAQRCSLRRMSGGRAPWQAHRQQVPWSRALAHPRTPAVLHTRSSHERAPCIRVIILYVLVDMGTFGLRAVCMMSGRVGGMRVGAVVSSVCRIELSQLDGGVREPLSSRFNVRQSRASRSQARHVVLSRQKGSRRRRRLLDSNFLARFLCNESQGVLRRCA